MQTYNEYKSDVFALGMVTIIDNSKNLNNLASFRTMHANKVPLSL